MKVNIGPYSKHFDTQGIEDAWFKRKYGKYSWELSEKDYDKADSFIVAVLGTWQGCVLTPINLFLAKIPRTEVVRLDYYDSWSANDTLSTIAAPLLKQLRDNKQGAPKVDYDDVPEDLRPSKEGLEGLPEGELDSKFFDRWDWVLNEMIYAHETAPTDWQSKYYTGESDYIFIPLDKEGNEVSEEDAEFYRMDNGPKHTLEYDKEGLQKEADRIQNGFRLFGKYYQNLWD